MIIFRIMVSFADLIGSPTNLDIVDDFREGGLFDCHDLH